MMKDSLKVLEEVYSNLNSVGETDDDNNVTERDSITAYADVLLQGVKAKNYTPLLKRETCSKYIFLLFK